MFGLMMNMLLSLLSKGMQLSMPLKLSRLVSLALLSTRGFGSHFGVKKKNAIFFKVFVDTTFTKDGGCTQ